MRKPVKKVMRGLMCAAVLLCAIGSANAQTTRSPASSPVEGGPSEPKTEKTEKTEKAEEPQPPPPAPEPTPDGFKVGGVRLQAGRTGQAGYHP